VGGKAAGAGGVGAAASPEPGGGLGVCRGRGLGPPGAPPAGAGDSAGAMGAFLKHVRGLQVGITDLESVFCCLLFTRNLFFIKASLTKSKPGMLATWHC